MAFEYIKVFGERNTGTNFLNQCLRANTTLKILEHGNNDRCHERAKKIYAAHDINNVSLKKLILERMIDTEREKEFPDNFGWKHAAPSLQKLVSSPIFSTTLFICLVRNPWKFLTSLHRNSYNLIPKPVNDFSSFLRAPFLANERDGLSDLFLVDPVDLWNLKVSSYYNLCAQTSNNTLLIFYEQLVVDPKQFFRHLSNFCKVDLTAIKIPQDSTKGDLKSYPDYRTEVLNYQPLNTMSKDDANYIGSRLLKPLMANGPYLPIYESLLT